MVLLQPLSLAGFRWFVLGLVVVIVLLGLGVMIWFAPERRMK